MLINISERVKRPRRERSLKKFEKTISCDGAAKRVMNIGVFLMFLIICVIARETRVHEFGHDFHGGEMLAADCAASRSFA